MSRRHFSPACRQSRCRLRWLCPRLALLSQRCSAWTRAYSGLAPASGDLPGAQRRAGRPLSIVPYGQGPWGLIVPQPWHTRAAKRRAKPCAIATGLRQARCLAELGGVVVTGLCGAAMAHRTVLWPTATAAGDDP